MLARNRILCLLIEYYCPGSSLAEPIVFLDVIFQLLSIVPPVEKDDVHWIWPAVWCEKSGRPCHFWLVKDWSIIRNLIWGFSSCLLQAKSMTANYSAMHPPAIDFHQIQTRRVCCLLGRGERRSEASQMCGYPCKGFQRQQCMKVSLFMRLPPTSKWSTSHLCTYFGILLLKTPPVCVTSTAIQRVILGAKEGEEEAGLDVVAVELTMQHNEFHKPSARNFHRLAVWNVFIIYCVGNYANLLTLVFHMAQSRLLCQHNLQHGILTDKLHP